MPALVWMVISFAGAQPQGLGEAPLASVHVVAVHRGVVEEVDAGIPGGADECSDVVIG